MKQREDFYTQKANALIEDLRNAHTTGQEDEMVKKVVDRYRGDVQFLLSVKSADEVQDNGIRRQAR
jgi:hypothetical protein